MRPVVRHLLLDPEPRTLPADPAEFVFLARLLVGPADGPGEESFDIEVCSPEWLHELCVEQGFVSGRHRLVTTVEQFCVRELHDHLERRVAQASGGTWAQVAERLARLGHWEFEDYSG